MIRPALIGAGLAGPAHPVLAIGVAGVFATLAGLHVAWALSGRSAGALVPARADGAPLFRPSRGLTLLIALALAAAAALVLGRVGLLPTPAGADPARWDRGYRAGTWALGAVLALRVVGDFRYVGLCKRERGTRFATLDTRVYTPCCALLAAGVFALAAG